MFIVFFFSAVVHEMLISVSGRQSLHLRDRNHYMLLTNCTSNIPRLADPISYDSIVQFSWNDVTNSLGLHYEAF